jgi:hypothetical protein
MHLTHVQTNHHIDSDGIAKAKIKRKIVIASSSDEVIIMSPKC